MTRRAFARRSQGYYGIGIENGKTESNLGTLWRTAYQMGAAFIFTAGIRYRKQASDTTVTWRQIPLFAYPSIDELVIPHSCPLVGIEMGGSSLAGFTHPPRAMYLLGAEDHGLSRTAQERCHHIVELPSVRSASFNVSVAGAIVMADRLARALP